ncbi:MAG: NAD(P)H-hydrate dehydratase, partial [bacterium]
LAVDAVFGTGIQPPVRGDYVGLFQAFNELPTPVLSVDIPSGVCGDTGLVDPVAVRADVTITVGLPKLGLLLPPGRDCTGDLAVVDIGFAPEVSDRHTEDLVYLTPSEYAGLLPPRASDVHKYQCGTVLVVAGSRAFGGAALLAGQGALRSGAGLVSVAVPSCLEIPIRCGLPEALVSALDMTAAGTIAPLPSEVISALLHRQQAVAIGPGLADDPATDEFVVSWLRQLTLPVVVDADALSAFARTGAEPRFGSSQVVLTPHAGELGRMVGMPPAEVTARKLELAPKLARQWGVTLLLKGSPAVIAAADGSVVINAAGDDSLAHGGTGDVLTGLIGGLLAQDCTGRDAAVLGAYLHAKAGQNAALYGSRRSVLAREVADNLGEVLADLEDLRA